MRGLSQEALAEKVGISRQTLSKLERGSLGKVSLLVFLRVLNALGPEIELRPKTRKLFRTPEELRGEEVIH